MMKTVTIITVLCAAAAFGGTASIVASFQSPCSYAFGIDYHGGYIYHGDGRNYIYQTTTTGSIITSYYVGNASVGIDRTEFEFWTCNSGGGTIFRLSTMGSLIRSFKGPVIPSHDVTYGEGFLWISGSTYAFKTTVNGSVVGSFELPTGGQRGICWDELYLWTAGSNYQIYQITQSGSIIDSFVITKLPYGVTWDGTYLWYSGYVSPTEGYWVYKVKVGFTPVAPASLGEVKALYR